MNEVSALRYNGSTRLWQNIVSDEQRVIELRAKIYQYEEKTSPALNKHHDRNQLKKHDFSQKI